MKRLAVALLCSAVALAAHARRVEPVAFPSLDRDANGAAVLLHAMLLLPAEPARDARPAIVALHGCGGMYSTRAGHEDELAERLALRADPLLRDGYAVLFVDSFRSRGVTQICTVRHADRTVKLAQRRLDALGALAYLAHRSDVASGRIALLGWSHGGSVALQTIEKRNRTTGTAFFRGAVAFYPGCASALALGSRYRPGAPIRVYIGELDDWTPAATCVELGKAMAARNEDLRVATYPDSYHGFDAPGGKLVHRSDVPNGVHPGEGVHMGPNAAARDAANASVRAFLRERLRD